MRILSFAGLTSYHGQVVCFEQTEKKTARPVAKMKRERERERERERTCAYERETTTTDKNRQTNTHHLCEGKEAVEEEKDP